MTYSYSNYESRFNLLGETSSEGYVHVSKWRFGMGLTPITLKKMSEDKFNKSMSKLIEAETAYNQAVEACDIDASEALVWAMTEMRVPLLFGEYTTLDGVEFDFGYETSHSVT